MTTHNLKTWPEHWDAVRARMKTFEVRRNDRGFQVGDTLHLLRWCPRRNGILPANDAAALIIEHVTYVLEGGQFGIEPGFVVLGLAP